MSYRQDFFSQNGMTLKIIKTDWGIKAAHNDKDSPRGFFRHKIIQIKVLETENQIYI
jgi:hypothetical protein